MAPPRIELGLHRSQRCVLTTGLRGLIALGDKVRFLYKSF